MSYCVVVDSAGEGPVVAFGGEAATAEEIALAADTGVGVGVALVGTVLLCEIFGSTFGGPAAAAESMAAVLALTALAGIVALAFSVGVRRLFIAFFVSSFPFVAAAGGLGTIPKDEATVVSAFAAESREIFVFPLVGALLLCEILGSVLGGAAATAASMAAVSALAAFDGIGALVFSVGKRELFFAGFIVFVSSSCAIVVDNFVAGIGGDVVTSTAFGEAAATAESTAVVSIFVAVSGIAEALSFLTAFGGVAATADATAFAADSRVFVFPLVGTVLLCEILGSILGGAAATAASTALLSVVAADSGIFTGCSFSPRLAGIRGLFLGCFFFFLSSFAFFLLMSSDKGVSVAIAERGTVKEDEGI